MLQREIDIMKKLSHPNVLQLREVFETDTKICLVTELVNGGELFEKIVEVGSYTEPDAANIVRQVVEGVAYLHANGVAHRDLKPENLLVGGENEDEIKIADFGLSKSFGKREFFFFFELNSKKIYKKIYLLNVLKTLNV